METPRDEEMIHSCFAQEFLLIKSLSQRFPFWLISKEYLNLRMFLFGGMGGSKKFLLPPNCLTFSHHNHFQKDHFLTRSQCFSLSAMQCHVYRFFHKHSEVGLDGFLFWRLPGLIFSSVTRLFACSSLGRVWSNRQIIPGKGPWWMRPTQMLGCWGARALSPGKPAQASSLRAWLRITNCGSRRQDSPKTEGRIQGKVVQSGSESSLAAKCKVKLHVHEAKHLIFLRPNNRVTESIQIFNLEGAALRVLIIWWEVVT